MVLEGCQKLTWVSRINLRRTYVPNFTTAQTDFKSRGKNSVAYQNVKGPTSGDHTYLCTLKAITRLKYLSVDHTSSESHAATVV